LRKVSVILFCTVAHFLKDYQENIKKKKVFLMGKVATLPPPPSPPLFFAVKEDRKV
jgi:hypothetical protein